MDQQICCIVVEKIRVKAVKTILEESKLLNRNFRITRYDESHLAIPVTFKNYAISTAEHLKQELLPHDLDIRYIDTDRLLSSKVVPPRTALVNFCETFMKNVHLAPEEIETVLREIPHKWEIHGDLVLFPRESLLSDFWSTVDESFWKCIAELMHVQRVALISLITNDAFRTPQVILKCGVDGWVEHIDNGVVYTYDVTKCMFSKGNITEKIRVGKLDCRGEVVVDLFAGIGYFTLPYLVKAGAKKLFACEWNPDAVDALRRGLEMNHVPNDRYEILQGDNRQVAPKNIADRVNLGLVPTSSASWKTACEALKVTTGGWLHIHENVDSGANQTGHCTCNGDDLCNVQRAYKPNMATEKRLVWCSFIVKMIETLESYLPTSWAVGLRHIEYVKSYGPHVDHLVFDILCRPPDFEK